MEFSQRCAQPPLRVKHSFTSETTRVQGTESYFKKAAQRSLETDSQLNLFHSPCPAPPHRSCSPTLPRPVSVICSALPGPTHYASPFPNSAPPSLVSHRCSGVRPGPGCTRRCRSRRMRRPRSRTAVHTAPPRRPGLCTRSPLQQQETFIKTPVPFTRVRARVHQELNPSLPTFTQVWKSKQVQIKWMRFTMRRFSNTPLSFPACPNCEISATDSIW